MSFYFFERLTAAVRVAAAAPLAYRTASGMDDSGWVLAGWPATAPAVVFYKGTRGIKVTQAQCSFTLEREEEMTPAQQATMTELMKTNVCSGVRGRVPITPPPNVLVYGRHMLTCDARIGELVCPLVDHGKLAWITRRGGSCTQQDCNQIIRLYSTISSRSMMVGSTIIN